MPGKVGIDGWFGDGGMAEMELCLLGPVELRVAGQVVDAGGPRQRSVLAVLGLDVGRVVSSETLIDRVWDQSPPSRVRHTLSAYVARIRALLRDDLDGGSAQVVRRAGGYVLEAVPECVDLHRFRALVGRSRDDSLASHEQAEMLGQALDLWRGPPLADLAGQWAVQVRQGWQQQYLDAAVAWCDAQLQLGYPATVVSRLGELTAEYPLTESLSAVFMRALCASGRPADALDHYARLQRLLAEELGTEPGPQLQQLHRQILTADPALAAPARTDAQSAETQQRVPRQLPAPPQMFTGRSHELTTLDQVRDTSTVAIAAIEGMAGVGKTALAVYAAHRLAEHYPHGQLFIDLHGYTQGIEPIDPAEALDRVLRDLGVPGAQIPTGRDQRAASYRSRLADQQMLIVLDNAATEAQVQSLLPGSPGCLVLVTSRRRLAGLDQTCTLSLETLPLPDAVTLLRHTAGEERWTGEPLELSEELVELCGRLPLAIRVAAARLRSHPSWQLADLAERLRNQQRRLGELEAGQRSVTAAFDLSYQQLTLEQQQAYRLLGVHPGVEFDAYATAALLDATLPAAGRILDQLLEAHLLQEPTPGRYQFHDLARAHAAATADQTAPAPQAALGRLLDYFRYTAAAAMDVAYPYGREHRPQVPPAYTPGPELSDPAAALTWLDSELPNLLAAARSAAEHGRPAHVLHLSTTLHRHLRTRGHYREAETLHQQALATASAAEDRLGELKALTGLGDIGRLQGRHDQAADHYQHAWRIAHAIDDRLGQQGALLGLGQIHVMQGRCQQGADHFEQALQLARALGNRSGEQNALLGLGHGHLMQDRFDEAADHYQHVLQIARATGNRPGERTALIGLGHVHRRQGQYAQAADHFNQVLQISRAAGDRPGELTAQIGLGNTRRRQGRHTQAADHYQQACDLAQASGDRNSEFEAWQGLGRLRHATGDPDAAVAHHERALTLAGELSQPVDQARAHDALAHAHHALHQYDRAREHLHAALDRLTELGIDHTDDEETNTAAIRDHLAGLDQQDEPPRPRRSSS